MKQRLARVGSLWQAGAAALRSDRRVQLAYGAGLFLVLVAALESRQVAGLLLFCVALLAPAWVLRWPVDWSLVLGEVLAIVSMALDLTLGMLAALSIIYLLAPHYPLPFSPNILAVAAAWGWELGSDDAHIMLAFVMCLWPFLRAIVGVGAHEEKQKSREPGACT